MQGFGKRWTTGLALFAGIALSGMAQASEKPLPPLGTPLAQIVDDLAWRSAQGEPEAACRLAMELAVCAVDLHRSWLLCKDREGNPRACASHYGYVSQHNQEVDWPRYVTELEAQCEGAPIVMPRELLARFRRAAFLGSVTAMRYYLEAPNWMDGWAMSRVRSIWPEGSYEARAVAQHAPAVRRALFHGGDVGVVKALAEEEFLRATEEWDESLEDGGSRSRHIEAMALMRYQLAVEEALPAAGNRIWRAGNQYADSLELLASEMTTEHIELAEAMTREWRETITLLPDQGPGFGRLNVDGSRYGGKFAPSRIATCNLVITAP